MSCTIDYYEHHAQEYIQSTQQADLRSCQKRFLSHLKKGASILDFGCGSGRETLFFLEQGLDVTALDGTKAFCEHTAALTGLTVRHELFGEFQDRDQYDGIWACASLLHCSQEELETVLSALKEALHENGILYASFKYGDFQGIREGRKYRDLTEITLQNLLDQTGGFEMLEQWISPDARKGRGEEQWLNIIVKKKTS